MGIPGLTTYINQHSDVHMRYYELHNTYLVIDGNSLASQIYIYEAKCNCCFGGDYDKYAFAVSRFFDELLQCNVTPLVIIDGGAEEKKIKTICRRTRHKLSTASNYNLARQRRDKMFPLLLKEVFKMVAKQKGIKCSCSLFEADDDIASTAKILDCPVLSFDSDFYIFGTMYIPFNTLERNVYRKSDGNGYVKRCKIYKIESLLNRFKGLDKSVLPLAATLLGNDYISRSTFRDFFCHLKLSKTTKRKYNQQQRCIEATFNWLRKHTLDSGIAQVLSRLAPQRRKKVLEIMEMVIDGYSMLSPNMLIPLGFSQQFVNDAMKGLIVRPYKFKENLESLTVTEEPLRDDESEISCNEEPEDEDDTIEESIEFKKKIERKISSIIPSWFRQEFNEAKFPSYFMDIITRQMYVCPVQIEDYKQPSTIMISLKIVNVIYKLLITGHTKEERSLCYLARGKHASLKRYTLEHDEEILSIKYPPLSALRNISIDERKRMLDETLGITHEMVNEFPPEWRLYIMTINYWLKEGENTFPTNCHLYALLFTMLFNTVDKKTGFHRSMAYFQNKCGQRMESLLHWRRNQPAPIHNQYPISMCEAFNCVTEEDCFLAVPFFLSNFEIDRNILMNSRKYNVSIIHAFAQFQSCLRHSMHLNALLGYPYEDVAVAEMFNGTLLYNLYNNFSGRKDIDTYISLVMQDSPSLLVLFNSLLSKVRVLFSKAFENRANAGKRRKRKNRYKKDDSEEDEYCDEDVPDDNDDNSFHDYNNRYNVLNSY